MKQLRRSNAILSKINYCGNSDKQRGNMCEKTTTILLYFLGFFTELLIKSKLKFHRLFRRTYGIIYERNSDVFIDFFRDLESYYDHGNVSIKTLFTFNYSKKPFTYFSYYIFINSIFFISFRLIQKKRCKDFLHIYTNECSLFLMPNITLILRK